MQGVSANKRSILPNIQSMSEKINVKCPNCNHEFNIEEAISKNLDKQYNERLERELKQHEEALSKKISQKYTEEYDLKLKDLEKENKEKADKLKDLQQRELDFLRKKKELEEKESSMEIELQKKVIEKQQELEKRVKEQMAASDRRNKEKELELLRLQESLKEKKADLELEAEKAVLLKKQEIEDALKKKLDESNDLKFREKDQKIDSLLKSIDELKRKGEQGSMQAQGETQELALENDLAELFPLDLIEEVAKGVKGADCIQTVNNSMGHNCGTIIYESKRTKAWHNDWIDKLKNDMIAQKANIAVLVTQAMPADMKQFGMRDGVWVCGYHEYKNLAFVLRDSLIRIHSVMQSQENKGDKMTMLYDYLTGIEFRQHMEAIVEGFSTLQNDIMKERRAMEKMWKQREKQIEKVMLNTSGMYGSIKGIAGASIEDLPALEIGFDALDEGEED